MGYPVAGAGYGSCWSSTAFVLVLFILLVIILRSRVF
ncbi:sporulation protein YjcZ [Paenibacillus vietnamensis]|nr:sporulation protein YjcZ [Paenibacillus vietnamensis]